MEVNGTPGGRRRRNSGVGVNNERGGGDDYPIRLFDTVDQSSVSRLIHTPRARYYPTLSFGEHTSNRGPHSHSGGRT